MFFYFKRLLSKKLLLLSLLVTVISCEGLDQSLPIEAADVDKNESLINSAPSANAGANQSIKTGTVVELDASNSNDPERDALTFSWGFISKPDSSESELQNPNIASASFIADVSGEYLLGLVVSDGELNSAQSVVRIISSRLNRAPVANAGVNQFVLTGGLVTLDGSASSDADLDSLSYDWTLISKPPISSANLLASNSATPTFTADVDGDYIVTLRVNDGELTSQAVNVTIVATTNNRPPIADAGNNQSVTTGDVVSLNGSASRDDDGDALTYSWSLSAPNGSAASLNSATLSSPIFTADTAGTYVATLTVNDGALSSNAAQVSIQASATASDFDDFAGDGALLGYTTNNESDLPDIARVGGRYRANVTNNANDITLHFNDLQGRLDAKLVSFPFEVIARNIGIGRTLDSQQAPPATGNELIFAGIQVHVPDLNSRNSSHLVVGHRGGTPFTVEGKNTRNSFSEVNDEGPSVAPAARADLRIVGNANNTLTVYWQQPRSNGQADNWQAYNGTGNLPGLAPTYGSTVYVGLITYAQGTNGIPFVGTCDSFEIIQL
ncbi:Chitinase [hydrothermal vent metagenome]|uniref:Chitinase n=1 Tax=hydrothermal vent metagenome TaxID=652676 RepID=A0A3B0XVQ7_9ZZZZ